MAISRHMSVVTYQSKKESESPHVELAAETIRGERRDGQNKYLSYAGHSRPKGNVIGIEFRVAFGIG